MVLQHENMRTDASEFGFHAVDIAIFDRNGNSNRDALQRLGICFIFFSIRRRKSERPIVRIR
jgi:hypothetical protein